MCGSGLTFGSLLTRPGFLGLALLFLFAQPALFCQLFFLPTQKLGLAAGLFLAPAQFVLIHGGGGRCLDHAGALVALDEHALLAHLDLNRARTPGGVGLLDLAGALARERDLLTLGCGGAMRRPQERQQTLFVTFGEHVLS